MIGGLIDITTLILFLLAVIILFKAKPYDIKNLISRKSSLLFLLFILTIALFILKIFLPLNIIPFILSLILSFIVFDIERKITFNKKIDKIKRTIQSEAIKQAEQIKTEQFNFEKEKLALEKQKEKVEEIQLDLENKIKELEARVQELESIQKDLEKERKLIESDKKKLNKDFERLKKLQKRKK